jgi:hypothetical protein
MTNKKHHSPWWLALFFVLFVVNIRVEAGLATGFERVVDGFFSGVVFLLFLYYAARFFELLPVKKENKSDPE